VHESLVVTWGRLRRWIEEDREELAFLEDLGQAARLWERRGRPGDEVWEGAALAEAKRKVAGFSTAQLTESSASFLAAGERRDRNRTLRKRGLLAAAFAALAALSVVFVVKEQETAEQKELADLRRKEAQAQRKRAEHQRAEALRESAAEAAQRGDLVAARAKLRLSLEAHDSPAARMLWQRVTRTPLVWRRRLGRALWEVRFSPDGHTIVQGSADGSVYLLDAATSRVRRALRGHRDQVLAVAWAPAGDHLASVSQDGEGRIWSTRDWTQVRSFRLADQAIWIWIAFSPDGRYLVTSSLRRVQVQETTTGREVLSQPGFGSEASFSPDGRLLAWPADATGTIKLWNLRKNRTERLLGGHSNRALAIRFSPDGRLLAASSGDASIRLWEVASGRAVGVLRGHQGPAQAISFSPDGKRLASSGEEGCIRLWQIPAGAPDGILHAPNPNSLDFSPDGHHLAASGRGGTLWYFDVRNTGRAGRRFPSAETGSFRTFSPDGRHVASANDKGQILVHQARTGVWLRTLDADQGLNRGVAFGPKGRLLASLRDDGSIRLWELESGKLHRIMGGHSGVLDVAFSPDGAMLASCGADKTVRLWRVASGEMVRTLRGHEHVVTNVVFSPSGRILASTGFDQTVRTWAVRSGRELQKLTGYPAALIEVSFSPDGRRIATVGRDGAARVTDLRTGARQVVHRWNGRLYSVDFHPRGRLLAVAGQGGRASIFDLARRRELHLRGHHGQVYFIQFSGDGELVATGGEDGTTRLWRVSDGRPIWRAPAMLAGPIRIYSHLGWKDLGAPSRVRRSADMQPRQWRLAIEERARLAVGAGQRGLCLLTHDDVLELWDRGKDRRLARVALPGAKDLVAHPGACVVLTAAGEVLHLRPGATRVLLPSGARAIAVGRAPGETLVVAKRRFLRFSGETLRQRGPLNVRGGVTAVAAGKKAIHVGYQDGKFERLTPGAARNTSRKAALATPSSPVTRILEGPMGTVLVGYRNGLVGLWHIKSGRQLQQERLHGPVTHLQEHGGKIYTATELGSYLVWDLDTLIIDYCVLMKDVWKKAPEIWKKGQAVLQTPPKGHPCQSR
jgi:WD40 repeat protein